MTRKTENLLFNILTIFVCIGFVLMAIGYEKAGATVFFGVAVATFVWLFVFYKNEKDEKDNKY